MTAYYPDIGAGETNIGNSINGDRLTPVFGEIFFERGIKTYSPDIGTRKNKYCQFAKRGPFDACV